jgi:Ca2+-binding EF-hand superfamily protein
MHVCPGQCASGELAVGGKFCRGGMNCRRCEASWKAGKADFIGLFALAWRLLTPLPALSRKVRRRLELSTMLFALGAVSSALDALQALTSSKSSSTQRTGLHQNATDPFSIDGGSSPSGGAASSVNSGNRPQISPETMSALIAAHGQSSTASTAATSKSPKDALGDLFSQIDADGDGRITKPEFENALGAGGTNLAQADSVFSKLDANSDGGVSLDEMSKALKGGHHGHHRAQSASGSGDSDGSSDSSQASSGSTRTSVTNSDGSTTTTIKYGDGFKVTTTVPGASSASSSGNSPYNWFEQMMQREMQTASSSAASSLSMSV